MRKTRWEAGLQTDYELAWDQNFQIKIKDKLGKPVNAAVYATWRLTVTDVEEDVVYVLSEFLKPRFHTDAYPDDLNLVINQQIKSPCYLAFERSGRLKDVYFLPEVQYRARMVVRSAALSFQYVEPSSGRIKDSWIARERDLSGSYQIQYKRLEDGRIHKTKVSVIERRNADPKQERAGDPPDFNAYFVTDGGWPGQVNLVETDQQDKPDGNPSLNSTIRGKLKRLAQRSVPSLIGSFSRERSGYKAYGLLDQEGSGASREQFKKNLNLAYIKNASVPGVLRRYGRLETDKSQWKRRTRLLRVMTSLLEVKPEETMKAIREELKGELTDPTRSFLFSVLAAAGTKEAQALLLEDVAAVPSTSSVLQRSGLVSVARSRPGSTEAIQFLQDFASDPENELEKGMALLGVGNQLGDLMKSDPEAGEPILNGLIEQFNNASSPAEKAILLSTLGNVGDPAVLPLVELVMASPHEILRSAAAFCLRLVEDPRADELIAFFLKDVVSLQVRKKALSACEYRSLDPLLVPIGVIMLKDVDTVMRRRAITMVGSKLYAFPQMVDVVKIAAANDNNPENRKMAAVFVEAYESGQLTAPETDTQPPPSTEP